MKVTVTTLLLVTAFLTACSKIPSVIPTVTNGEITPAVVPTITASDKIIPSLVPTPFIAGSKITPSVVPAPSTGNQLIQPPIEDFSGTSNPTNPDSVLKEIVFGTAGGGGSSVQCAAVKTDKPVILPVLEESPINVEFLVEFPIISCGWDAGEDIQVTIKMPDGKTRTDKIKADSDKISESNRSRRAFFKYKTEWGEPLGVYEFVFSGRNSSVKHLVKINRSTEPRVILRPNTNRLLLYNFNPNENVRLYVYKRVGTSSYGELSGWKSLQTNAQGSLEISLQIDNYRVAVYRNNLVQVPVYSPFVRVYGMYSVDEILTQSTTQDVVFKCVGAPPRKLELGMKVRLISANGLSIKIYKEYVASSQSTFSSVASGSQFEISRGPYCDSGKIWWGITTIPGYVSENATDYKIESVEDRPMTLTPVQPTLSTKTVNFVCTGAPQPRIQTGGKARVTFTNGIPIRVRNAPGARSEILILIPEGTVFSVIDGPRCQDGAVWWNIRLDSGTLGWVMEGEIGNYYVEPWK